MVKASAIERNQLNVLLEASVECIDNDNEG